MSTSDSRDALRDRALAYAREHLGPVSTSHLAREEVLSGVSARMEAGRSLEDAVLGQLHAAFGAEPELANEFFAFLQPKLQAFGPQVMGHRSSLRLHFETSDLRNSVMGNLWPRIDRLTFETLPQYLALWRERMRHKAGDYRRRRAAFRRSEQRRSDRAPESLGDDDTPHDERARPDEVAAHAEFMQSQLPKALLRLSERSRLIVGLQLDGRDAHEIAHHLGLTVEAARAAIKRANDQLKKEVRRLETEKD